MSGERALDELYPAHWQRVRDHWSQAMATAEYDWVLVTSGSSPGVFLDDEEYPFKPNPHFLWWLPLCADPVSALFITPEGPPLLLHCRPEDYWQVVPPPAAGYWSEFFAIEEVRLPEQIAVRVRDEAIRAGGGTTRAGGGATRAGGGTTRVGGGATRVGGGATRVGGGATRAGGGGITASGRGAIIGDPGQLPAGLEALGADLNPPALLNPLHFARGIKSPYELQCLRLANRRGAAGHLAAAGAYFDGASEFEIHLAFLEATGHTEANLPYPSIIARNGHGATLHYNHYEGGNYGAGNYEGDNYEGGKARAGNGQRRREGPDCLLIDAGASWHGYASDITRTYARPGDFAGLLAEFDALQQGLMVRISPGEDYRDFHRATHLALGEFLQGADIIRCDAQTAVAKGLSSVFLPHGVGHLLGLQVHDAGGHQVDSAGRLQPPPEDHPFLRLTRTMEEDMVFTVEPGVYFIEPLLHRARADERGRYINWQRVEQLAPWGGIRIEDNIRVSAAGAENLTRDAFAALERQ